MDPIGHDPTQAEAVAARLGGERAVGGHDRRHRVGEFARVLALRIVGVTGWAANGCSAWFNLGSATSATCSGLWGA